MAFGDNSEKTSITTGTVTSADLREAHARNESKLRSDMSGEQFRFMEGSRFDMDPRGVGAVTPSLPPEPEPRPMQADFLPPPAPSVEDELAKFKKLYGQSENEKGEIRRKLEEMEQRLNSIGPGPQFTPPPQFPPGWGYPPQGYIQPQWNVPMAPQQLPQPQAPERLFPERDPNEPLTWGELDELMTTEIAPAFQNVRRDAREEAVASIQRQLPNWDVQPQEEQQALYVLRTRYPGFDGRFMPTERNAMIYDYVRFLRAVSPQATPQARPIFNTVGQAGQTPPQPPVIVDPSAVVRKDMHIESAPSTSSTPEPVPMDIRAQFLRERDALDAAYRQKTGNPAPASAIKELLVKYGVQEVNDWGEGVARRA